ncbi:MAG: hypothetical protein HY875_15490 [Chloroflexi bacterium]|nr:hypothetical protein [Chloroflexota bacterium]
MSQERLVIVVAGLGAAAFLVFGLWPFFWPRSFYDELATFEPYNVHFIHDIGAFQLGIGVTLALALWRRNDALLAALGGAGAGSVFHAIAHFRDDSLGGKETDVFVFGFLAVLLLAGAYGRLRASARQ